LSKLYWWVLSIVVLLNALAAFIPLIPSVKLLLPQNPTAKETLDTLITFLGINITLATAIFGLGIAATLGKSESNEGRIEALLSEIRSRLGLTTVQLLHDHEFYPHFRRYTESAERSVYISYFEFGPPGEPGRKAKLEYYHDHFELVRRMDKVAFRRLFRDSAFNKEWIKQLLQNELQGAGNIELAIYRKQNTTNMPLPLSVQIIDAEKVWFVAIATHGREREPRDIFVENSDLAMMMEKYYNRLWERSEVIYQTGLVTEYGEDYLNAEPRKRNDQ